VQTMTHLQNELKQKKNNIVIFPLVTSLVHRDAALLPLYNINPPTEVSYRNFYFYIPPIGKERLQTLQDERCMELLEEFQIPSIPEYPLAGTEIQKENLLQKYLC